MTNYITEKDFRQAVFTKLTANQQKCLDFIVKQFTLFDQVFISQQAIADAIGLSRKTVCIYIKYYCQLGFLNKYRRFDKQFKKSNIYTLNSFFKEMKERLAHVLPSLKGWLGTPIYSGLKEKVTISIKGVINAIAEKSNIVLNSSVFSSKTVKFKADGGLDLAMTHEELMFYSNISYLGIDMDLKKIPINKLTDEEWEDVYNPTKERIKEKKVYEEPIKGTTKIERKVFVPIERPVKHLGKKEAHPFFAQFTFPGDK